MTVVSTLYARHCVARLGPPHGCATKCDTLYATLRNAIVVSTLRDAETTVLIKFAFWRGLGREKFYGKLSKTQFFLGNFMTIKFGIFANVIVRNFVVIWEAPTHGCEKILVVGVTGMVPNYAPPPTSMMDIAKNLLRPFFA